MLKLQVTCRNGRQAEYSEELESTTWQVVTDAGEAGAVLVCPEEESPECVTQFLMLQMLQTDFGTLRREWHI